MYNEIRLQNGKNVKMKIIPYQFPKGRKRYNMWISHLTLPVSKLFYTESIKYTVQLPGKVYNCDVLKHNPLYSEQTLLYLEIISSTVHEAETFPEMDMTCTVKIGYLMDGSGEQSLFFNKYEVGYVQVAYQEEINEE